LRQPRLHKGLPLFIWAKMNLWQAYWCPVDCVTTQIYDMATNTRLLISIFCSIEPSNWWVTIIELVNVFAKFVISLVDSGK
jgi:hypothetical protein